MSNEIDEGQMAADFASIPDRVYGPTRRARLIVNSHIATNGRYLGHQEAETIREEIAIELGLAEIRGTDRARGAIDLLREGERTMGNGERVQWRKRVGMYLKGIAS